MKPRARWQWLLVSVAFGALLLAGTAWQRWRLQATNASTPQTELSPPKCSARVRAEGRVVNYPGAHVEVGSELAGVILEVPVLENQPVEKGALLAQLKSDELHASLAEAKARVNELEAEQRLAEHDLERSRQLLDSGAISRQEFDRATRDLDVIRARHCSALATVARLQATLAKTRIVAPISGSVLHRLVEPGETVEANTRLFTVADLNRVRVEAEVDEFDAGQIQIGQMVIITAEGFSGKSWHGRVEEVPQAVVDKGLQPRDPSRPIDVRVLLAKIAFEEPTPLKLGQRVEVEISD